MTESGINWQEMYDKNFLPWHKNEVHEILKSSLDFIIKSIKHTKKNIEEITFFLPLCGKSLDLLYLYQQGFQVIGCDIVEDACQQVFTENKLPFQRKIVNDRFCSYESLDSRLRIYCGDLFEVTEDLFGVKIDCIWDRGSIQAIDVDSRDRYVAIIKNLINEKFVYLMKTIERENPPDQPGEMPHTTTYEQVQDLFKDFGSVRLLGQKISKNLDEKKAEQFGGRITKDNTFLIQRKSEEYSKISFWHNRWATGNIRFHKKDVNPYLFEHYEKLQNNRNRTLKFFFPLCGKTLDLAWVYSKGHFVVGVEAVALAVENFFKDANIRVEKEFNNDIDGWIYKSTEDNGRLTIFCCDLFKMHKNVLGDSIDCVFDRGSYVAIEKEDRKKYIKLILSLVAPKFRYLLVAYEYDETKHDGPPRHVEEQEVKEFFTSKELTNHLEVNVTVLGECEHEDPARHNLEYMKRKIYLIENP